MSLHPLIDKSNDRQVKQAKGFREAAAELTGASLSALYDQEVANAPKRHDVGKKHFAPHSGKPATERKVSRDGEHLAIALVHHCRESGEGLKLPDGEILDFLDYQVTLQTAAADKALGDQDPNKGVPKIDLLGGLPDGRFAVVQVKYLAPDATRGGTGDTPLRALLEGLALAAITDANRPALKEEALAKFGRELVTDDQPPSLILLGSPRYWEICRKREAQKGAGWIRELQRLSREIAEEIGVEVGFYAVELEGDPGWEYGEKGPVLAGTPRILPAWESTAGKLKPKPKPRPNKAVEEDPIIEADLSIPVRSYAIGDSYNAGERIEHPTLGLGVVQGIAGRGKIKVLFDGDRTSLLVHERS